MQSHIEDLYVGDDFHAKGEYVGGFLFFHCEIFTHNKSTINKIRKALYETMNQAKDLGYDKPVFAYVEKGRKSRLSRMMGGTLCNTFVEDGRVFEVYVWE